jgi:hypothetical protein
VARFHPANLRAAWWALRTARRTRRLLDRTGLDSALAPPPPPPLPAAAVRGVRATLRRVGETCLVNAIVLQTWEAAHGTRRDLVIGTTGPQRFRAHAWLQGDPLPAPDEPGLDASELVSQPGDDGSRERGDLSAGTAVGTNGFTELLRRPAPRYTGGDSTPVP